MFRLGNAVEMPCHGRTAFRIAVVVAVSVRDREGVAGVGGGGGDDEIGGRWRRVGVDVLAHGS